MNQRNGLPAIHPGEFLRETLEELGLSQAEFARALGVSKMQISHLVRGARPISAEMALLIGKALGQTPEYWLNLQMDYDLKTAAARVKGKVRHVKPVHQAA
jgi:addiction module antidote protein, HigA family